MLKGDSKIMEIRLLTESDVRENTESLRCHLENCIVSTYEIENIRDFTEKKINDLLIHIEDKTAIPIAAFDEDIMAGFLWGYETKSLQGKAFHIAYISVDEACRGKGIASAMIGYAEKLAAKRGLKTVELIVGADNEAAYSLYKKMDFTVERLMLSKPVKNE